MNIAIPAGPRSRGGLGPALAELPHAPCAHIPKGLRFEGTGQLPCNTVVEGEVEGELDVSGPTILLVVAGASASGTINCSNIRVEGRVHGEINCPEGAVEIAATAQCKVKLVYRELSVERGADVEADFIQVGGERG